MTHLEQLIETMEYKKQGSSDFVGKVMKEIFFRAERRFQKQILFTCLSIVTTLGIFFYVLVGATSEILAMDLYEYVDLGVSNPDVLTTAEWQTTVMEAIPVVEIALLVVLTIVLVFLSRRSIHLIYKHLLTPYAS
ncbi:MAG: hypothetical protein ACK4NC_01825 [Candidatus Gracilibacteria bacterium]